MICAMSIYTPFSTRLSLSLCLTVCVSLLIYGTLFFGTIADEEDYSSTVLTTQLFLDAVWEGESPFWTNLLGLGLPQPFRISWVLHPLSFLFLIFSSTIATKIIILIHGVFATLCTFLICTRLKINNFISAVCAISFALSSSNINYLHVDDWPLRLSAIRCCQ